MTPKLGDLYLLTNLERWRMVKTHPKTNEGLAGKFPPWMNIYIYRYTYMSWVGGEHIYIYTYIFNININTSNWKTYGQLFQLAHVSVFFLGVIPVSQKDLMTPRRHLTHALEVRVAFMTESAPELAGRSLIRNVKALGRGGGSCSGWWASQMSPGRYGWLGSKKEQFSKCTKYSRWSSGFKYFGLSTWIHLPTFFWMHLCLRGPCSWGWHSGRRSQKVLEIQLMLLWPWRQCALLPSRAKGKKESSQPPSFFCLMN